VCTHGLEENTDIFKKTSRKNGYSNHNIKQALHSTNKPKTETTKAFDTVMLAYQHALQKRIARCLLNTTSRLPTFQ